MRSDFGNLQKAITIINEKFPNTFLGLASDLPEMKKGALDQLPLKNVRISTMPINLYSPSFWDESIFDISDN